MAYKHRIIPPLLPIEISRFWAKVEKSADPDGCWLWTAAKDKNGYGIFQHRGDAFRAHRISYELAYGPVPDGLLVCHKCDNPSCVRPDHFFLGTVRDNARDASAKGRTVSGDRHPLRLRPECRAWGKRNARYTHPESTPRGERQGMAKLTAEKVREIRSLYASGQCSYAELSERFGHNTGHIGKIIRREVWAHVV